MTNCKFYFSIQIYSSKMCQFWWSQICVNLFIYKLGIVQCDVVVLHNLLKRSVLQYIGSLMPRWMTYVQGVLIWNDIFWEAVTGRKKGISFTLKLILRWWDLGIFENVGQTSVRQTALEIWICFWKIWQFLICIHCLHRSYMYSLKKMIDTSGMVGLTEVWLTFSKIYISHHFRINFELKQISFFPSFTASQKMSLHIKTPCKYRKKAPFPIFFFENLWYL